MPNAQRRAICWTPIWNKEREGVGLEHLLLTDQEADSVVLAFDEAQGPFRLAYRLAWDEAWRLRDAELAVATAHSARSLSLHPDGEGQGERESLNGTVDGLARVQRPRDQRAWL